jgi:glyoxylase-like metal-dependent hydrolase (beta-lactamase superfamily II)
MKQIAQDVYQIEGLRASNVYLLVSDDGLTLIDAGMAGDLSQIAAQMGDAGHALSDLASIVVTHAHADHIGGVAALIQQSDARVIAHQDEVPYVEGTAHMPASSPLQRVMQWLGDLLPTESPDLEVARALEEDDILDVLGGLRVIHTPGSMCLYQEEQGLLFCGDLLFTGHPLTGRGGLQYAPRLFSVNQAELKRSTQKLANLSVRVLCVGHGEPIVNEPPVAMETLLETVRG